METTMLVQQDALPIIKSSLELKRKTLELNMRQYRQRLASFEQTHHMTSTQFADRYNRGELGDDAVWFEWEFALDGLAETERQLKLLDTVKI